MGNSVSICLPGQQLQEHFDDACSDSDFKNCASSVEDESSSSSHSPTIDQADHEALQSTNPDLLPKDHTVTAIDPRDIGTPDSWIPRHPDLIRLTGKHPFNCEPPLTTMYDQGFITPLSLHYVRSHGKTPRLSWKTHRITIQGLVNKPMTFNMDDLAALPSVTMPVTLVCAGNRRKENNMIKQTRGFHWGAAAHSTSLWTGVKLSCLLQKCEIDLSKALHVRFSGTAAEELPPGTFGSSVDISTALNTFSDILIAYKQNGALLQPDHGFPVRVIIPGWVGGRMVKWLDKIEVSKRPSESHYHYYDNRIFPSFVDAELADAENYWKKEEYVFNELNVNSAIVHPENNEQVAVSNTEAYTVKGYAYSGGGRKITRVEFSIDGGKSWKLCQLNFPEEKFSHASKYGYYYCWMFWKVTIDMQDLVAAASSSKEIRCRAWDQSNNTQPSDINWNMLGYGNNCHYVLKIRSHGTQSDQKLEFLHPTVAGPNSRGWMKPPKPITAPANAEVRRNAPASSDTRIITKEEVARNNSRDSAWIIIDGSIYDTTSYLDDHPGAAASILIYAGQDATDDFHEIHSEKAKNMLKEFKIGVLANENEREQVAISSSNAAPEPQDLDVRPNAGHNTNSALNPDSWNSFPLLSKTAISPDTRLLRFKLPSGNHRLGLPVGGHVLARATVGGRPVMRAYTPVSIGDEKGSFTLCVKVYFAGQHPQYPNGSKMSLHMEHMTVGQELSFTGPLGHVEYKGRGKFSLHGKERKFAKVGLICGGTGITPAYQVMRSVFEDPEDTTSIALLYGNRTEEDILMREDIEQMQAESTNLHVWYTVQHAKDGWKYSTGFISEEMIGMCMSIVSEDTLVLMCGPPAMVASCTSILHKLGHREDNVLSF